MPPKRKDNSATSTSAASGPKPKRSKPSFRTPTTAGSEATATSEVNSTKNRVVTLRASASGRRGYRTQDLATNSNSNPASPTAEPSHLPSHIPDDCDSISHPTELEESDIHPQAESGTKSRPKQKNTTTVRPQLFIGDISLNRVQYTDKTY